KNKSSTKDTKKHEEEKQGSCRPADLAFSPSLACIKLVISCSFVSFVDDFSHGRTLLRAFALSQPLQPARRRQPRARTGGTGQRTGHERPRPDRSRQPLRRHRVLQGVQG